jgi:hypothetical protein
VATTGRAPSGPDSFDEQIWRAEGGSDSAADVVAARPVRARGALRGSLGALVASKRNLAIAAAGLALVAVVTVFATSGDEPRRAARTAVAKTESVDPRASAPAEAPATAIPGSAALPAEPASAAPTPEPTSGASALEEATSDTAAPPAPTAGETPAAAAPASEAKPKKKKAAPTLAGKQVVLEYDTQAREAKPMVTAPKDEQAAISRARTSYAAGNTRLFAGDADGAIRNYRQALAYYPGYVAGYRGLGLAYAQKGDKANALKALRTYVATVPNAKDAPLIRKRIQMLSK